MPINVSPNTVEGRNIEQRNKSLRKSYNDYLKDSLRYKK